jgi:hypothetical protein
MHGTLLNLLEVSLDVLAERTAVDLANTGETRILKVLAQMPSLRHLEFKVENYVRKAVDAMCESFERDPNHIFWIMMARKVRGTV